MLKDYEHNAKYYETDQMGCGYRAMEEAGVCSPVLEVNCRYKSMVRFGDTVRIHAWIKEYNGIRMTIGYEMRDVSSGELRTQAESAHCFLTLDGRPVSLKRSYPEWDKLFRNMLEMEAGKGA